MKKKIKVVKCFGPSSVETLKLFLPICTKEINRCVDSQFTKHVGTRSTKWLGKTNWRNDNSGCHQFSAGVTRWSWKSLQQADAFPASVIYLRWCNPSFPGVRYIPHCKMAFRDRQLWAFFWADYALFMQQTLLRWLGLLSHSGIFSPVIFIGKHEQ